MKKYTLKLYDEYGNCYFDHSSDYAYRLIKAANKEKYASDGSMFSRAYFGREESNIPESVLYAVSSGEKV